MSDKRLRAAELAWKTDPTEEALKAYNRERERSGLHRVGPTGNPIITLDTRDLFNEFGYEVPDSDAYFIDSYWPSVGDIVQTYLLDVSSEDGRLLDAEGTEIDEDTVDEIARAIVSAMESGNETASWEAISSNFETMLEDTFSGYDYDYEYTTSEGETDYAQGIAEGIIKADVSYENITVEFHPDTLHIVNNCIAGYGMFTPGEDEWEDDPVNYIRERLHWLNHHWAIYGDFRPEVVEFRDDFDERWFATQILELEAQTGRKLLADWARKRHGSDS